jgi:EAL domain-containing protein (putative c-di-GMP-specific phosphodiesterase class I)
MITSLEVPFSIFGERVEISASIGGVLGVRGATTASMMLRDADAAMYAAKSRGSGLVEVFDEAASHHSLDRLQVGSELTQALARGQLSMHYQPICHLRSGRLYGFEALLRWHHPERGLIPADLFIPLAEEAGAISAIGTWALEEACRQQATWQRLPGWRHVEMSINVSAVQLQQPDFAVHTLDVLGRNGIDPADVWLEITEHSAIHGDVTRHATTLRTAGVRFALDDFGIAYSNLSHLNRLPVEALKIDRSFVAGLSGDEADQRIVRAILAIAGSLRLGVVAEGIETPQQRDLLLEMGDVRGQGFLLSPPLDVGEATALLLSAPPPERAGGPARSAGPHVIAATRS